VAGNYKNEIVDLKRVYRPFRFSEDEMIIFHEWFDAKVKGIPYNHVEVMERMRKKYCTA
jgi:hypothetical protein